MSDDFVHDEETLYRRIPAGRNLYKRKADGTIEISSQLDNTAHAEITNADNKGAFHRLCRRLVRLAEARQWEISPNS